MSKIKPQVFFHTERPIVRGDISSQFDIAVEIKSSISSDIPSKNRSLNLCIVIDRSGSMEGAKLDVAKQCCINICKRLDAADQ